MIQIGSPLAREHNVCSKALSVNLRLPPLYIMLRKMWSERLTECQLLNRISYYENERHFKKKFIVVFHESKKQPCTERGALLLKRIY